MLDPKKVKSTRMEVVGYTKIWMKNYSDGSAHITGGSRALSRGGSTAVSQSGAEGLSESEDDQGRITTATSRSTGQARCIQLTVVSTMDLSS